MQLSCVADSEVGGRIGAATTIVRSMHQPLMCLRSTALLREPSSICSPMSYRRPTSIFACRRRGTVRSSGRETLRSIVTPCGCSGPWLSVQRRGLRVNLSPSWTARFAKYPHETCTLFVAQTDALSGTAKVPAVRSRRAATV